jgi:hypothetical protein
MKTRTILVAAAALALAMALPASAQAPNVCLLGASDGHATISPALHGDALTDATFFFTAECPDGSNVCSNGTLSNASCLGNLTAGHYVLCDGACTGGNTGAVACAAGVAELTNGDFNGVCAGPLCAGGGPNVAYALVFDQQTVSDAMAHCGGDPLGDGAGLSDAHFGGPILYLY